MNIKDGAGHDVVAIGFWECSQTAYFYVKMFNPFAPMQCQFFISVL